MSATAGHAVDVLILAALGISRRVIELPSMRLFPGVLAACLLGQLACDTSRGTVAPPTPPDVAPATIEATTPLSATGEAGAALATPIRVQVRNRVGIPLPGIAVTFRVATGAGSVNPPSASTDSSGIASAVWTLGPTVGSQSLSVSAGDLAPIAFTATARPAAASVISKLAGDGQTAVVNTPVATPLAVRLVDPGGNPVGGAPVAFTVVAGGGSIADATTTTGADGIARAGTWTLGTKVGVNSVQASAGGNLVASFSATSRPGAAATVTVTSNVSKELRMGDTFVVRATVLDAFGNDNSAEPVRFTVSPAANATVDSSGTVTTIAAGRFTVTASAGAPSAGSTTAQGSYSARVIGHPTGTAVAARLFVGVDPGSVAVTDEGIFAISATGRNALVTRIRLDGSAQFGSLAIESPASSFLIVAPKAGGGTAVVVSTGEVTSSYWFVDVATNKVVDSVTTLRYVQGAAMSADGKRGYFMLDAGELAVVDMDTHQFLPSIPLGGEITSFRAAPGDTIAYARSAVGTMLEVDLKARSVRRQFNFPPYPDVEPSRDLSQFFVMDTTAQLVRILRSSDLAEQRTIHSAARYVAVSPDSRAVFMSHGDHVEVAIGDTENGFYPGPRFATSGPPLRVLMSLDGSVAIIPTTNGWIDIVR